MFPNAQEHQATYVEGSPDRPVSPDGPASEVTVALDGRTAISGTWRSMLYRAVRRSLSSHRRIAASGSTA